MYISIEHRYYKKLHKDILNLIIQMADLDTSPLKQTDRLFGEETLKI